MSKTPGSPTVCNLVHIVESDPWVAGAFAGIFEVI